MEEEIWTLSEEGRQVSDSGSHEVKVFNFVPAGEEGTSAAAIKVKQQLELAVC